MEQTWGVHDVNEKERVIIINRLIYAMQRMKAKSLFLHLIDSYVYKKVLKISPDLYQTHCQKCRRLLQQKCHNNKLSREFFLNCCSEIRSTFPLSEARTICILYVRLSLLPLLLWSFYTSISDGSLYSTFPISFLLVDFMEQ